jgi:hypothetical protein
MQPSITPSMQIALSDLKLTEMSVTQAADHPRGIWLSRFNPIIGATLTFGRSWLATASLRGQDSDDRRVQAFLERSRSHRLRSRSAA